MSCRSIQSSSYPSQTSPPGTFCVMMDPLPLSSNPLTPSIEPLVSELELSLISHLLKGTQSSHQCYQLLYHQAFQPLYQQAHS